MLLWEVWKNVSATVFFFPDKFSPSIQGATGLLNQKQHTCDLPPSLPPCAQTARQPLADSEDDR
jgi:hypothetical protein